MIPRLLGKRYELRAQLYLKRLGAKILAANYTRSHAEIDIIARLEGRVVFIEVKYRADDGHGSGRAAVDINKRRNIIRAARYFIKENDLMDLPMRFDVIEFTGDSLTHIRGAFDLSDSGRR